MQDFLFGSAFLRDVVAVVVCFLSLFLPVVVNRYVPRLFRAPLTRLRKSNGNILTFNSSVVLFFFFCQMCTHYSLCMYFFPAIGFWVFSQLFVMCTVSDTICPFSFIQRKNQMLTVLICFGSGNDNVIFGYGRISVYYLCLVPLYPTIRQILWWIFDI